MAANNNNSPAPAQRLHTAAARGWILAKTAGFSPLICAAIMAIFVGLSFGYVGEKGWATPDASVMLYILGFWLAFYLVFLACLGLLGWRRLRLRAHSASFTSLAGKSSGQAAGLEPGSPVKPANDKPGKASQRNGAVNPVNPAASVSAVSAANPTASVSAVGAVSAAGVVNPTASVGAVSAANPANRAGSLSPKRILAMWAVITLSWLPMLIAMYPGVLYNDTNFQLSQYFGNPMLGVFGMQDGSLFADHQPIFDTFVFGLIVDIGRQISGSIEGGLFTLVLAQALVTSFSFAFSCNYLERVGARRLIVRVVLVAYCLFPLFSWIVTLVAKDSFFSWIYLWFIILIFEFIHSDGKALRQAGPAVAFCLVCILLALTKKPGLYLVVSSCLILLLVYRKAVVALIAGMLAPLLVMLVVLPMVVFPAFKVSPGTPVELLGIFYQQTARYVLDNPNDVSAAERQIIDDLLGYETIEQRYDPVLIDPLKGYGTLPGVEAWPSSQQLQDYFGVYLAQGLRHPASYFNALGALNASWFYPWSYGDGTTFELAELAFENAKIGPQEGLTVVRPPQIAQITAPVVSLEKEIARAPIIRVLYTPSFYILFLPLLASLIFWQGSRRYLGIMIPVWVSFCFLFISPTAGPNYEPLRYVMPFIYTSPLLLALAVNSFFGEKSER